MSIALSIQVGGDHYKTVDPQYQPISLSDRLNFDANQHTILKYITRRKNRLEDLAKALHTCLIGYEQNKGKFFEGKCIEITDALYVKEFCKKWGIDDTLVLLICLRDYKTLCDEIFNLYWQFSLSGEYHKEIGFNYREIIEQIDEQIKKERCGDEDETEVEDCV